MKRENIPGWPNYYISKRGRLFSNKSGKWEEKKCIIANGRPQYRLYRSKDKPLNNKHHEWYNCNTESRWFKVSRLVAMVYIQNPNNYPIVMHLDDDKTNNKVENLQWGTYIMNTRDAISKGRLKLKGENNPNAKLSDSQVNKIRKLYYECGYTQVYLAKKFKVAKVQISRIIRKIERG